MTPANVTATRLQQLADDCEDRARRSTSGKAKNLYFTAATECRLAMTALESTRCRTLVAMTAQAALARWYDGEDVYESARDSLGAFSGLGGHNAPSAVLLPSGGLPEASADPLRDQKPDHLLNARQLGARYGVPERGARKTIERGLRRDLAGFYRDGRLMFAAPDAFERLRQRQ